MKKLLLGATLLILLFSFAVPSLAENPGTINSQTWLDKRTNWEGDYEIKTGPVYVAKEFTSSNGTITNYTTGDAFNYNPTFPPYKCGTPSQEMTWGLISQNNWYVQSEDLDLD